ncbi:MAG: aminotransferase class IV [Tissierellia bacterium]|nr:aminotransferase class IV [Tissierellia bacterium]
MKAEAIKEYYIVDGKLIPTKDTNIFYKIEKPPIYEVLRVIDGIPLFLEDHIERMRKSGELVGININRSDKDIENDIRKLVEANNIKNLNVKLLVADVEGKGQVFLTYFIRSFYPPEEYYREGIHTILLYHERENPNAKVQQFSFREEIDRKLQENNAFEVLLVNKDGYVTEGSRSNMFFVKGNKIYTSPKGTVLLGITRKYIMEVCKELNIEVVEENTHVDDLKFLDGAFMSGTSVNVLPISTIDDIRLNSVENEIIKKVGDGYLNKVKEYMENKTL